MAAEHLMPLQGTGNLPTLRIPETCQPLQNLRNLMALQDIGNLLTPAGPQAAAA